MSASWYKHFWLKCLFWAACYFIGTLSVDTVTPAQIPKAVLESLKKTDKNEVKKILNNTRRIVHGVESKENRPYMVYLKLPKTSAKFNDYKTWLCGGVIIHEEFILTSAACIEDVKHFYVVAGTLKFSYRDDRYTNNCIKNGAKKAIWKCTPKNYVFDGHENDNLRWMANDIAVVKMEDEFDFTRRVRGCDYAPKPICYNNASIKHEEADVQGFIAGWGSTDKYNDWVNSRKANEDERCLLETTATIITKNICKRRWGKRYKEIIDNFMFCTNGLTSQLSELCQQKYAECDNVYSESGEDAVRRIWNPDNMTVHSANHKNPVHRRAESTDGGFCENDHGGPFIKGEGSDSMVVGIISACLVKEKSNQCYGPFLYTSVYKNRVLINCAIYKTPGQECNKLFRSSVTFEETEMSWADHPDGPAKSDAKVLRTTEDKEKPDESQKGHEQPQVAENKNVTRTSKLNQTSKYNETKDYSDIPLQHSGFILRTRDDNVKDNNQTENHVVDNKNVTRNFNDTSKVVVNEVPHAHSGFILRSHDEFEDKKDALIAKIKASAVNKTKT